MHWFEQLFDPNLPQRTRRLRAVLLAGLGAACAFRVWLVFRYNPLDHVWSDPQRHWYLGAHPLDTSPMAAIDPIGYQAYLAVIAKLTVHSPSLVAYWIALLSLAGPWLWYRFLRELLPSRDWALVGWVLLAALPSWSAIYSYFMQETLMLPLLGAALWATWRCRRKRDTASFITAVALWLAAGLTRGICIPLAAVAMIWLWFEQDKKREKAALSALLLSLVLVPLAGRTWSIARVASPYGIGSLVQLYHRAGTAVLDVEFTRRGGKERWNITFTSPAVNHAPFAPFSNWRGSREGRSKFTIDLDAGNDSWQAALDGLPPRTPSVIAWLTAENLAQLFFAPSWPDSNLEKDPDRLIGRINYWSRWIWAPLAFACLVITLRHWRRQRERLLPALVLTFVIVHGILPLAVNEGRYRKPLEGMLVAQCLLLAAGTRRRAPLPAPRAATTVGASRTVTASAEAPAAVTPPHAAVERTSVSTPPG